MKRPDPMTKRSHAGRFKGKRKGVALTRCGAIVSSRSRRSREMVVARHRRVRPGQRVVDEEARPHDEAVPRGALQGEEEGRRPHEVWGERLEQQAAFVQRLADELHVEVFEVAQASVDELTRTA
jgi:hypothetical protein